VAQCDDSTEGDDVNSLTFTELYSGWTEIPEETKEKLRAEHTALNPFALKKSIEVKLKKFFAALGNLDRESTTT